MMDAEKLAKKIEALQEDEQAIVEVLLDRIEQGRTEYGPWKVNDGRDYRAEAFDEVIDALHYCAAALIQTGGCRREAVGQKKQQGQCHCCSSSSLQSQASSLAPKVRQ